MAFSNKDLSIGSGDFAAYGLSGAVTQVFSTARQFVADDKSQVWEFLNRAYNGGVRVGMSKLTATTKVRPADGSSVATIAIEIPRIEAASASSSGFTPAARKVHDVPVYIKIVRPPQATDEEMKLALATAHLALHPTATHGLRNFLVEQTTV